MIFYIRIIACLLLAAIHALFAAMFIGIVLDSESTLLIKLGFGFTAFALCLATVALATRPFLQLPTLAVKAYKIWCFGLPLLFFFGSFDSGLISGQELLLILFVAGFSLLSWKVFLLAKST